jgi:dUTP pyrophosphatase
MPVQELVIKVTRVRGYEDADLPLPYYLTEHAAGLDLYAAVKNEIVLAPGEICLIGTGIAVAIPEGYEGQVRPRSGLALQHGLTIINSPGTIDADYRGEVGVGLVNFGKNAFTVKRGDRIAQLVISPIVKAKWSLVLRLEETERNEGGFGHTGIS